jgi:hypothetical protein
MEVMGSDPGLVKSWSCTSSAFIPISLRPFPPLANSDFSGHDFLPFRWLVFTNSVSRTASRPTGCLIKYGVIQFDEC